MYKVFINPKVIYLTDSPNSGLNSPNLKVMRFENSSTFTLAFSFLENTNMDGVLIFDEDVEGLFEKFKKCFKYIEAAGGMVMNNKKEYLFIKRFGIWDLPKGKVEQDENYEAAAKREVEEECGIGNLEINGKLSPSFHIYTQKNQQILKKTFWFKMSYSDHSTALIPQEEEGISEVKWVKEASVADLIKNSYETIKEVVQEAMH